MPIQLTVPQGNNQLLSAVSIALLLPLLDDEEKFDSSISSLFGRLTSRTISGLLRELDNYNNEVFPASLENLIQTKLRPKLADYISGKQTEYAKFFSSTEELQVWIETIRHGTQSVGVYECSALAQMINTTVRIYSDVRATELSTEYPGTGSVMNAVIHLAQVGTTYHSLIDPAFLPERLRHNLLPYNKIPAANEPVEIDRTIYQRAQLKLQLIQMFSKVQNHLAALSTTVGRAPSIDDPFRSPNPTDLRCIMRFDPVRETHTARLDMKEVHLTTAYSLCLMSSCDGNYDHNRLYIEIEETQFKYTVRNPKNDIRQNYIPYIELNHNFQTPVTIEQLSLCLPKILEITSKNGDTAIEPASIGNTQSWLRSMGYGAAVGAGTGLSLVGGVSIVGECAGAGALLSIGIPISTVVLVGTLIASAFGKTYAVQFEKALNEASDFLNQGRYTEAADRLDEEFNRFFLTKAARTLFLTKQHYAIAHFFRGVCAERLNNISKACFYYREACEQLAETKSTLTVFVAKLQLLKLLRQIPADQASDEIHKEITFLLLELTRDYKDGFAELYWQLHDRMTNMANKFSVTDKLDRLEIKAANLFLVTDGLFMLKHYANGSGAFMELFSLFFQGAMLAYFNFSDPSYLDKAVQEKLSHGMTSLANLNVLAFKKFKDCAKLLKQFKEQYASMIQSQAAISQAIMLIEMFMLHFDLLSSNRAYTDPSQGSELARLLGIQAKNSTLLAMHNSSIEFLIGLKRDFGLSHETVDEWLAAIIAHPNLFVNQVAEVRGDTMLHALTRLPYQEEWVTCVQKAALALITCRYLRNDQHETPLFALNSADPYKLKQIIDLAFDQGTEADCATDIKQRKKLLTHLFRGKKITTRLIEQLAEVTMGYSQEQLQEFVTKLRDSIVTQELLKITFNQYAVSLAQAIEAKFKFVTVSMPLFECEGDGDGFLLPSDALVDRLNRLKNESSNDSVQHTLLYGPHDSGKKTAVRILAQKSRRVLISLRDDQTFATADFNTLIANVKKWGRVLLLNNLEDTNSEFKQFMASVMNSLTRNNITLFLTGITREDFKQEMLNSVCWTIPLPKLSAVERNRSIKKCLVVSLMRYPGKAYFDEDLRAAMEEGATELGIVCENLKIAKTHIAISYLISDLCLANPSGAGITYIRLQDVQFYMNRMREQLAGTQKVNHYIEENRASFFPEQIPTSTCQLLLLRSLPSLASLSELSNNTHGAYVRVQQENANKLYYFHKSPSGCFELAITPEKLAEFDRVMQPTKQAKILSKRNLTTITAITDHSLIETIFSIDVLNTLRLDFGLNFDSIEAWLRALLSPGSTLGTQRSTQTGDTMLHLLLHFISGNELLVTSIKQAISHLKDLRFVRNYRNETPLLVLQSTDPYQIKDSVSPAPFVKIGDSLIHVEEFLRNIEAKPALDSHFLLIDGPPGTGKSTVLSNHLQTLGYSIHQWIKGTENDGSVGGLLARIKEFFQSAKTSASESGLQILMIDEIDGVIPELTGIPRAGFHSKTEDNAAFLEEVTALKGTKVVLIGMTNFPERLAKPLISRAGVNRITFPLPNDRERRQLLDHFFVEKQISDECIEKLATISVNYSPRQLQSFVEKIKEKSLTFDKIAEYFNAYAQTLRNDFHADFRCAEIFMPSFAKDGDLSDLFSFNAQLKEQLRRLENDNLSYPHMHTLFFGPPGGGKTTAIRIFAQTSGQVLISIQATHQTSQETISKLFTRAKQFGRCIIFFDEIHNVTERDSPHVPFLLTEMDGITENNITVIGATNNPEKLDPAIKSRFMSKIEFAKLSEQQLTKPIKKLLLNSFEKYARPDELYVDEKLAKEMRDGAVQLARESAGLDLRNINACIAYLFGDLFQAKSEYPAGITYLQMQDISLTFLRMKIQEKIIPKPDVNLPTSMEYITANRDTFFQRVAPQGSVAVGRLLTM